MTQPSWIKKSSRIAYKSQWLQVREDTVIQPNGTESSFDIVERRDFVLVIAKQGDRFVMVEQFRYPIQKLSLEFVEGGMEEGEMPEVAAKRELGEETGMISNSWNKMGYLYLGNGTLTQGFHIFLAEDCSLGKNVAKGEETDLVVKEFTLEEIKQMIIDGTIHDSPTVAAFCRYILR